MATDRKTVKMSLSAMTFPASKEEIVSYAENTTADEATVRALRAMPVGDYDSVSEVEAAVPLDKGTEEGQSSSDKAQQHRKNTQSGLAEQETDIPANPIVEELGENRGS